jgi:hypothetical protein
MSKNEGFTREEIIRIAAKAGADAALAKLEQAKKQESKEWRDRRFRNTKLLLSNYRDFKTYADNAVYSVSQAEEYIDISLLMWDPHNKSEQIVEAIKKSAINAKICMAHVDGMIHSYDIITANTRKSEERRRYEVLYDRYISELEMTVEDIAAKQSVEPRTVYMDIEAGLTRISKLFFGLDFAQQN